MGSGRLDTEVALTRAFAKMIQHGQGHQKLPVGLGIDIGQCVKVRDAEAPQRRIDDFQKHGVIGAQTGQNVNSLGSRDKRGKRR